MATSPLLTQLQLKIAQRKLQLAQTISNIDSLPRLSQDPRELTVAFLIYLRHPQVQSHSLAYMSHGRLLLDIINYFTDHWAPLQSMPAPQQTHILQGLFSGIIWQGLGAQRGYHYNAFTLSINKSNLDQLLQPWLQALTIAANPQYRKAFSKPSKPVRITVP